MSDEKLKNDLKAIANKYENLSVQSANYNEETGQLEMRVSLRGGPQVSELPPEISVIHTESAADLVPDEPLYPIYKTKATRGLIELDPLRRQDLDLLKTPILHEDPQRIYQRSIDYYRTKDIYGTAVNVFTNFASKGFENDIDDPNLKNFFDSWVVDVGFDDIVDKIFFDFFRVGLVRTYRVLGKYIPKVGFSKLPTGKRSTAETNKEKALRKNRFSNTFIPIAYTFFNPTEIVIKGSMMFGQTATFLKKKAGEEIKVLLEMKKSDLSEFQRKVIAYLPADFKKAVLNGDDIPLDPELLGEVDYRRMPYERYPLPRGARSFEALEFKDELRKADYSTLDGITNYILLIRVGNDNNPVKKQETLEKASELFDTVSKSYKVVWNHTLDVEKITSPEIGEVLGQDKYVQVNEDITGGLGIIRALIDGRGESNAATVDLAIKAMIEEINYARRQVQRWIYSEYRFVATALGIDRIPKVRFDDMALRDEIKMMAIVQGMIDRRIISYHTGQKKLGYDPAFELSQMDREQELVESGILGIIGSPFQQSRGGGNIQPVQRTPSGTPSEGRPRGGANSPRTNPPRTSSASLVQTFNQLSLEDLEELVELKRSTENKVEFLGEEDGGEE